MPAASALDTAQVLDQLMSEVFVRYEKRIEGEIGVRSSRCTRCGADATLRTARVHRRLRLLLAFVVPLGRRVHVDQCSECGKSAFTLGVRTWERLKAATFSAARAELAHPEPGPEHWLDEHRARAVFGDEAGASDLAHQLAGHPRASARLLAELAQTQRWQGHHRSSEISAAQAEERAAPEEDPLRGLRLELALDEGDLDQALECVAAQGVLGDLRQGALRRLLQLLVERRRARELHRLLGPLLRAFPYLAYSRDVRRAVRYANGAVDGARPIALPRLPGEHRTRNLVAAAALLLVALSGAAEIHARLNRAVWFVTTRAAAFEVSIDGAPAEALRERGARRLTLAYGEHEIAITGAREARFPLTLEPRGPLALLDERVYVVDVAGDAIFSLAQPKDEHQASAPPPQVAYGRDVHVFDGVELAFGERRHRLALERSAVGATLALESRGALALAMEHAARGRSQAALALLADRIERDPARDDLDLAFAWTAADCGAQAQALTALANKLSTTPLAVRAHDAARYLLSESDAERLRAEYQARHAAPAVPQAQAARERSSAALLRAHLCAERAEALEWLARARAADPGDVRVLRHSADLSAGVDWRAALGFSLAGLALEPHDAFLLDLRSGARMALGEAAELERELRTELERFPRDQERQGRLAELLVVTQRATELDLFISDAERRGGGPQRAQRLRVLALEAGGRLEELAASSFDPRDEERTRWQVLALCELGRAREFGGRLGSERRIVDRWYDALAIDVGFRLVDDRVRAHTWRERALHRLARHSAQARVAALLSAATPASPEAIVSLALGAHETAVVLLAHAQRAHGAERAELLRAVERMHPWPGHVQRFARRLATTP